jgi:hypothetical protein
MIDFRSSTARPITFTTTSGRKLTAATKSIGRVARRMTQFSSNSWNLSDDRSDLPQGSHPSAIYASCKLRHAVTNDLDLFERFAPPLRVLITGYHPFDWWGNSHPRGWEFSFTGSFRATATNNGEQ